MNSFCIVCPNKCKQMCVWERESVRWNETCWQFRDIDSSKNYLSLSWYFTSHRILSLLIIIEDTGVMFFWCAFLVAKPQNNLFIAIGNANVRLRGTEWGLKSRNLLLFSVQHHSLAPTSLHSQHQPQATADPIKLSWGSMWIIVKQYFWKHESALVASGGNLYVELCD